MAEGFIDSASAYEVVLTFARKKPRESFKMEWDRALEVTATLVSADHIKLAPSPRAEGAASGAYGVFLKGLESRVSRVVLPDAATVAAIRKTRKWAGENVEKLRTVLGSFTTASVDTSNQAPLWLDAHIQNEWHEHVLRRGSLFDRDFNPQIAKVLDLSEDDVRRLWSSTTNANFIANIALRQPNTEEFRMIRDAFVVSCLLRGRYHDYAAEASGKQILSHPVREAVLRKTRAGGSKIDIQITNTERYLSNIAVGSAFVERSQEARVALWVENVLKLRAAREVFNFGQKDRDEAARDIAIEAAQRVGIRVHSKMLETVLDVGIALGSTALTSFVLLPWESMLVGSGMYALSAKKNIGGRVASAVASLTGELNRLSKLAPGRIQAGNK